MTEARQRLILVAAILGTTVVTVDGTVVNVALPAIEDDLGGGLAGQQWTSNAYLVTLGSLLLIGGSLGDIFGERRVFALGVLGFGLTSLICALAPTIEILVAARALQGVAGALLTPAALAVIVANFAPDERGRAVGAWTAWGGIGTVLGPLIGGQLVDAASWRWIFAINVPIVIGTLILILRVVPQARERVTPRSACCGVSVALPLLLAVLGSNWSAVADRRRVGLRGGADHRGRDRQGRGVAGADRADGPDAGAGCRRSPGWASPTRRSGRPAAGRSPARRWRRRGRCWSA